ncbi:ribose-phosphate pyrophosphokinase [Pseudomonas sp. BN417]|uniref:ribose-phosphate pyrophosphokinase-like domain-containing protein n=1 Tax=Pseudomonas sp. BN417 TaxID=2567890 RepID=UPI00245409AC|nr:ribose-phosphate pyrophosphokinase-like domain-containing protein [Pseudomonas sp. BN417]MDH4559044.1 ribose-phosphate pyrophosphokinase [Pseudomonas sp. BN417]
MVNDAPLIFALRESQPFATRVARHLAIPLSTVGERRYEDGEYKCHPLEPVTGRNVVVFAGLYPEPDLSVHDKLCRLLFFCSAIKDAGARHLQVVSPYLCYTRKERRIQAQDPVITRYLATLMEASSIDGLTAGHGRARPSSLRQRFAFRPGTCRAPSSSPSTSSAGTTANLSWSRLQTWAESSEPSASDRSWPSVGACLTHA